ncbi:MAG: AAA family ATPase [Nibricoccus sp.]
MILERLVIENFRQFRGRQEIIFSDNRSRNVTLVHAENGFGKTTLLNAFRWVLHGTEGLTKDFEKPEEILNDVVARGGGDPNEVAASVELTFKHDIERITITRRLTLAQQRADFRKPLLTVEVMRDGQTFRDASPPQKIRTIVPEGIAEFLFFNGENIDHLAMEENSTRVAEAIRVMLGLQLLQTTIDDLKNNNVRGKFVKELRDNTSEEKQALLDEEQDAKDELIKIGERRVQVVKEIEHCDKEVQMIDYKLEANREAAEFQLRRGRLQNEERELQNKLTETTRRLSRLIAEDGYTLFAQSLVERGREIVCTLRAEGKIPARVLNTFLQELLESGNCICKRCLPKSSPERAAVENLLTIAGDQEFNNAVGALDHALGLIDGVAIKSRESLRLLNGERLQLNSQIRRIGEELEEIHQKIGAKADNQVQELEESRRNHLLKRDSLQKELGRLGEKEDGLKSRMTEINKIVSEIVESEAAAELAQRRKDAVDDCIKTLEEILEAEITELRPELDKEINRHFQGVIDRNYWAELTEQFSVRVRKTITTTVETGANSGENVIDVAKNQAMRQSLSLAFIGSLVALAGRRAEIPTIVRGLSGAVYPIVMDSPFGSLDRAHREGVAKMLPALANQVVAFVSSSQYDGPVEQTFSGGGLVGKRYYLVYHGPKLPPEARQQLKVEGQTLKLYQQASEEYTEIREI